VENGYPCFEISAINADKPPLTISQIKERVKQFEKVGEILTAFVLGAKFFMLISSVLAMM